MSRKWAAGLIGLAMAAVSSCSGSADGTGAADPPFPIAVTADRVALGEQAYSGNCASCHGAIGAEPPVPSAPSHADDGHTWHHADRQLFDWVLDRPPLATIMPAFRGILSDEEVSAVIAYIKSRWPRDILDRQTLFSEAVEEQLRGELGARTGSPG